MIGIFAVYKPKGPTSHDIVAQIKRSTGQKVGHAGTLDPLASGVLVVGVGREATKQLAHEVKKEKEYVVEITLGAYSTTDDAEGTLAPGASSIQPLRQDIEKVLPRFIGVINQTPPQYSAIKVKGLAAYRLARQGKVTTLQPRPVEIKSITLLDYQYPRLRLQVVTGPGVYIRSLARDLGQALGCGGYVSALERTRVGDFTITQATRLDSLK